MTRIFVYEFVTSQTRGANEEVLSSFAPSLVREGRAMLDAIASDWAEVPDVEVIQLEEADTPEAYRACVERADFCFIIAPESSGVLERLVRQVEELGREFLGPSSDLVRLTTDKLALARHFAVWHVPTPQTWPLMEASSRFPQVWKPIDGCGSQDTFFVASVAEAERLRAEWAGFSAAVSKMIAQEYYPGIAASQSFLVGPRELIALPPSRQLLSDDGRFSYLGGELPLDPSLADRVEAITSLAMASLPGLRGYIGVDVVLGPTPSEDVVIEVNPRLTTSYLGLRALSEHNLAEVLLRLFQGQRVAVPRWRSGQIRFDATGNVEWNPS